MKTYRVQLDARPIAGWTSRVLDPIVVACRFEHPSPIELRPTGLFGGWCMPPDFANDGRVCVSSRAVFWPKRDLISVYVHECTHNLLNQLEQEHEAHGPLFFSVNLALLLRCDSAKITHRPLATKMSLYDMADVPDCGLGRAMDWAVDTASKLAASSESAEQIAVSAERLYAEFLAVIRLEPALADQVASLKSTVFKRNIVVSVLSSALLLMTVFASSILIRRFA